MKTTALARLLIPAAALLLALFLGLACGDDDDGAGATAPVDLQQYFTAVGEIFDDAEEATNEAEATLNDVPASAPLEEQIAAIDTYLTEIDRVSSDAIERLEAIDAPDVVADEHQDFIDSVRASLNTGNALRNDLPEIEAQDELDDRLSDFSNDIDADVNQTAAACRGLQEIADAEGVAFDLNCEN